MSNEKITQGIDFLTNQGLTLFSVLDCETLPADIKNAMLAEQVPLATYSRLVLIGNSGERLWSALNEFGQNPSDPVDHFSRAMTQRFITDYLDDPDALLLYPKAYTIPLQKLGALANWHHPSPLGLGINAKYGLWFAYRAVFLTTKPLTLSTLEPAPSPCDSCQDKPCMTGCPAQAVQGINQFNFSNCFEFRLAPESPCRDRCLSRLACPIGIEHRYTMEQLNYHYNQSITTIQLYVDSEKRG